MAVRGASVAQDQGEQRPHAPVDFSLWSARRAKAYADALAIKLGAPLAVLSINKFGLCVPVFNGTDALTLNRGAGRILGTAWPGEPGNIGIAGHRDGFFRRLKDVKVGDQIELAALHQKFVYTVDNITVVAPSDVNVLRARKQGVANVGDVLPVLLRRRGSTALCGPGLIGGFHWSHNTRNKSRISKT